MSSLTVHAEIVIDLDAVYHNVRVLRRHAGTAALMAVVKADGYNHGAVAVAATALSAGAREVGVTTITEAIELRDGGIRAPILCWLNAIDDEYDAAIERGIEIAIPSREHLRHVLAAATAAKAPAIISIKVDTGLNRNGASSEEYPELLTEIRRAARRGLIRVRGIFSHLACADDLESPTTCQQRIRFLEAINRAAAHGIKPHVVHIANSAALLSRSDLHFDMVRPGIAIYGLSPLPHDFGLVPAMALLARVVLVKEVRAGQGVSYGHTWIAQQDTTVALLPIGYADGVPRALSGQFHVMISGVRYPSIGRVCMDQLLIDLGPSNNQVREGDTAELFGNGLDGGPVAQDWANALGTIHYEIVTAPRGRVSRRSVGGGLNTEGCVGKRRL